MASAVNPDIEAQMKRIWSALNDGTVDVVTARDALRQLHDILSGAAYEAPPPPPTGGVEAAAEDVGEDEGGEDHPHRRARKRR